MLFGFLILGAVAVVGALRRLPVAYGGYALAALFLPLSYPVSPKPLASLPRYEVVLFPLFMWGAVWVTRRRLTGPALARWPCCWGCSRRIRHLALRRLSAWTFSAPSFSMRSARSSSSSPRLRCSARSWRAALTSR